jgi:hypothetical protein
MHFEGFDGLGWQASILGSDIGRLSILEEVVVML